MDKFSRVIFALLFSLASLMIGSDIGARGPSTVAPATEVKAHSRPSVIPPVPTPAQVDDRIQTGEHPLVELPNHAEKKKFPCASLQITAVGVICDGYRLDFPEVIMNDVLEEGNYLPRKSGSVFVSEKVVGDAVYRNLTLDLHWEPATPEFLQIYLKEYLPYWDNRIPYRLFWNAHYEVCGESCSTLYDKGEFLPTDIGDLSPSLAADVNFNGVPAAFWNQNIKP